MPNVHRNEVRIHNLPDKVFQALKNYSANMGQSMGQASKPAIINFVVNLPEREKQDPKV